LAAVTVTGLLALEYRSQFARILVAERNRSMDRLVQRAMLYRFLPVAVQDAGGKPGVFEVAHGGK